MSSPKPYLGIMIDLSRNAVMNMPTMKRFIDIMAKIGYNCLFLYMEDTYEVDNEPYFGLFRGRYSKAELKEIDAYAASKGIECIPCIQTLAHFDALCQWGCYKEFMDIDNILLAGDERSYALIDNIFSTLSQCFASRKIHIGMDEAHALGRGQYLDKNGYVKPTQIMKEHLAKVCELCAKYDFEPIMWSDMFFRILGGDYYIGKTEIPEEIKAAVPSNVSLVYWDYYSTNRERYDNMIENHLQFGSEIWFGGGLWCWNGPAPFNQYSIDTTKAAIDSCRDHNIKNVMFTMWGDNGKECSFFSLLPAMLYAARAAEGVADIEAIKAEFSELFGLKWDDFMALDRVNFCADGSPRECKAKALLYNDVFMGNQDVFITEECDSQYAESAEMIRKANGGEYQYIFDTLASLCDVLKIKSQLGLRLRKAYKDGDKKALESLLSDFDQCIENLKVYYEKFETLWHIENKPQGFDVQDIRLGGLQRRLEHCRKRLADYLEGKLEKLEELEETPIGNEQKRITNPWENNWKHTVTCSIL